jgi:hypothetical protein
MFGDFDKALLRCALMDELVKMAREEWPELVGHLDNLDVSIVTEPYGAGYACLIRERRIPPPADSRYPKNYFPRTFFVGRDAADGTEPIGGLAQFLEDNRIRFGRTKSSDFEVRLNSHEDVDALVERFATAPANNGKIDKPFGIRQCRHGKYMNEGQCKRNCRD